MTSWLAARHTIAAVGICLLGALVGLTVAGATSAIAPAAFTSSAHTRVIVEGEPGHAEAGMRSALRQAQVLADLAVSPPQLERIGRALHPPVSASELADQLTARRQPDLLIITFSARDADPARAAAIANAAAENLVATAGDRNRVARIRLEQVGPATVPDLPSHRHLPRNLVIGAIGGAAIGLAAFMATRRGREQPESGRVHGAIDRWPLIVGAGFGLAVIGGMALRLPDAIVQGVALLAGVVAAISPGAGLATIALTITMPEPPGFAWLSYPALLTAACAYGLLLAMVASRSRPRFSTLGLLAFAYLAVSAVSTIPLLSGLDGERTVNAAARIIQVGGGILLVAVAWSYFSRRDPRPHLALVVGGAALAGFLAIIQYGAGSGAASPLAGLIVDPPGGGDITRATGPFSNPNYFGHFLSTAVVLALSFAAVGGRVRWLALAAIPIGIGLILTFSRGSLLAAGVGVVALIWLRSRAAALGLALIAVTAFIVLLPVLLELRSGPSPIVAPEDFGNEISDSSRYEAMLSALAVWRLDPVFGVGFGQFGAESAWFVGSSLATSSHNEYLSILAEQGILGSILFAALAGLAIHRSVGAEGWSRTVGLAPLVALAAGAVFSEPLGSLQTSGLTWLTLGAVGGVASVARLSSSHSSHRGVTEAHPHRSAPPVRAAAR